MSVEYRNIIVQHLIKITGIGSNIGKIKMLALWKIEDMFGEEFLEDPFQKVQTDIILLEGYSEPIGYINFSESEMRWLRNVSDAGTLIASIEYERDRTLAISFRLFPPKKLNDNLGNKFVIDLTFEFPNIPHAVHLRSSEINGVLETELPMLATIYSLQG